MTTRTDAHRPSAINPLDYQFVAHDYYGSAFGMDEALKGERNAFRAHMASTGGKFSGHEHGGTCFVCGAAAMYVAKFFHPKSNTYIVTGEDCANKMHMGDARAFRSFRDKVGEVREAAAGKLKAQKTLDAAGLNKAWDIYVAGANTDAEMIVRDIVAKLVKYGSISEKQEAFIARLLRQIADAPAIAAQRAGSLKAMRFFTVGSMNHSKVTRTSAPRRAMRPRWWTTTSTFHGFACRLHLASVAAPSSIGGVSSSRSASVGGPVPHGSASRWAFLKCAPK